jgi:hypothetical protein
MGAPDLTREKFKKLRMLVALALVPALVLTLLAMARGGPQPFAPNSTEFYIQDGSAIAWTWSGATPWSPWNGQPARCIVLLEQLERANFEDYALAASPGKLAGDMVETIHFVCEPLRSQLDNLS